MKPVYVINFKAYPETIGSKGLAIAKILDEFAKESGENILIAVQPTDIRMIAGAVSIPVLAESIDPVEPGAKTGHITLESVLEAGADGTLVNHSENRIPYDRIKQIVEKVKNAGKMVIVCAKDPEEGSKLSKLEPDYVAVEPPELIGGDISVSTAKPEIIAQSVELSDTPILVGAGVKNRSDVQKALELGAKGVLVASGIVKKEVRAAIEGLIVKQV